MNLGSLMRIHNGNWPAICRAGRWGAGVAAILLPTLELALGDVLPSATIGLLGCAALFVPILVAGKLNEQHPELWPGAARCAVRLRYRRQTGITWHDADIRHIANAIP